MRTDIVCIVGTAVLAFGSLVFAQQAPVEKATDTPLAKVTGPLVTVEVDIIEVSPKTARLGRVAGDDTAFIARLRELEKEEQLPGLTRLRLSTLEGTKAATQLGGDLPVVTGRGGGRARGGDAPGGFGGAMPVSVQYRSYGTILEATAHLEEAGTILVAMDLNRSGQRTEAAAVSAAQPGGPPGTPADPEPQFAGGTTTLLVRSTLRLKDGQTVVAQGFESTTDKDATQTIVLLTARVEGNGNQRQGRAEARPALKVFALKHVDANSSVKMIKELIPNVSVAADPRTNALIASGPEEQLQTLEALLLRLDEQR